MGEGRREKVEARGEPGVRNREPKASSWKLEAGSLELGARSRMSDVRCQMSAWS
jgi:hypothetical protein